MMPSFFAMIPDSNNFDTLVLDNPDEWDLVEKLDGARAASHWTPISVSVLPGKAPGHFPSLTSNIPVFDKPALDAVLPLVKDHIEPLALRCHTRELWAIHVLSLLDCLDYDRSAIKRFAGSGRIMDVTRYAFHKDKIARHHIFRLADLPTDRVFVSGDFKTAVEFNKLAGCIFQPTS